MVLTIWSIFELWMLGQACALASSRRSFQLSSEWKDEQPRELGSVRKESAKGVAQGQIRGHMATELPSVNIAQRRTLFSQ